jgi:hypothetical protein
LEDLAYARELAVKILLLFPSSPSGDLAYARELAVYILYSSGLLQPKPAIPVITGTHDRT